MRALALGRIILSARLFALLFLLVLPRFLLQIRFGFREAQRSQQPPRRMCIRRLVGLGARQVVERQIRLFAEIVPPLLQNCLGRARRRRTAHALSRQQGEGCRRGQLILARHPVVTLGVAILGEPGVQIGGDAIHVAGAINFDARLL